LAGKLFAEDISNCPIAYLYTRCCSAQLQTFPYA